MEIKSLRNFTEKVKGCFVLFLTMMALLAPARMWGQETITIGEGTATYYNYPINMYFNYSLTEQIYTADEIGFAGTINSISFYYNYTYSFSLSNVTLYMKNVTRDSFSSNTDMEPLSTDDIVWNGTFAASGAGWMTINLNTPFEYDGTSNLLVAAYDGTSGYPGSSYKFRTTTCTGNKAIQWYSDSYCPAPYNTGSGYSGNKTVNSYRNNIQINITPSSNPKPQGLAASNVTAHGATLSWTVPNEDVIGYAYQYQPAGGEWTDLVSTTETSVTLSSLTSDTDYDFQVKAIYADDESNFATTTFHTEVSCPRPVDLQATLTQGNATVATLNWTESGTATDWVLQYSPNADFTNAIAMNVSNTPSCSIINLTPETKYYARVKADCGDGDQSQWSNPITFRPTNCNVVTIGEETNTTYMCPVTMNYNYSMTQQIYTPEEIGMEGTIYSISFYYDYIQPFALDNIRLFLKSVSRSAFIYASVGSATDREILTSDDLVWTGTFSATAAGWVTIDLDTPFVYDGSSNLLVCVCDNTSGKLTNSYVFRRTSCSEYKSYCYFSDNTSPDPYSTTSYSGGTYQFHNNIQVGILPPTCPRPMNLQATLDPTDATVASLSWTEKGTATSWVVEYGTAADFTGATSVTVNGTPTCNLTGLTPESRYYARVKAVNGTDESQWSKPVDFRPNNCRVAIIGDETSTNATYCLPITMSYNYSLTQQIYTADEIGIEGSIRTISFYYTSYSSFSLSNIKMYMKNVTRSAFPSSSSNYEKEPLTADNLVWTGTLSASDAGWVTIDLDTPFAYDGLSNLLVAVYDDNDGKLNNNYKFKESPCTGTKSLYWYHDTNIPSLSSNSSNVSHGTAQSRNVIKLEILPPSCPRPVNLQATLTEGDNTVATLSWTENGSANDWVLQYGSDKTFAEGTYSEMTSGFVVDGTTITANLTNLTPEQRLYARVKAVCGSDDESLWSKIIEFRPTTCDVVEILGNYGSTDYMFPVAMSYNYSLSQQIYTAEEIGAEGMIYSISFRYNSSSYPFTMNGIEVYMKNVTRNVFASQYDNEPLSSSDRVWRGTLSASEAGWITLNLDTPFAYDGVSNLLVCVRDATSGKFTSDYKFATGTCSGYKSIVWYGDSTVPIPYPITNNPTGVYSNYTGWNTYRNQIQLGIVPVSCPRPDNLQATFDPTNATIATLSWTEKGEATSWVLEYGTAADFTGATTVNVSGTPSIDLTGLTAEAKHYARVKADCGSAQSEWSYTIEFRPTLCTNVTIGTGTGTDCAYPVNMLYNCSRTQQIYTAEEIGMEGLIYDISFYYSSYSPFSLDGITMSMKNVTRSEFTNSNAMEPTTEADIVWTGTLKAIRDGWVTITLDTPFAYDGVSNLLVEVYDGEPSGKLDSYYYFSVSSTSPACRSVCWYDDSAVTQYSGTNPGYSSSASNSHNDIQLSIMPDTHPRPNDFEASLNAFTPTLATLSWTERGEATNWTLQYGTDSEFSEGTYLEMTDGFTVDDDTITANLTGLTPETTYYARVKSDYDGGIESGWSLTCVFTPTAYITIGDGTSSSYAIPIYAGFEYSFSQQIYTAEEIAAAAGGAGTITSVSFYYQGYTSAYSLEGVQVYMINTDKSNFTGYYEAVDFSLEDKVYEGPLQLPTESGWVTLTLDNEFDYDGTNILICVIDPTEGKLPSGEYRFRTSSTSDYKAINNFSSDEGYVYNNLSPIGMNQNRYRNDIRFLPTLFPKPRNLTVSNITPHTADLAWEAHDSSVTGYQYQYKLGEGEWTTPVPTTNTSVTLQELTPEGNYTFGVQALYADGTSTFATIDFTVLATCPVPTDLQYALTLGDGTVATLTWEQGYFEEAWVLQYGTDSLFTDGTYTEVNTGFTVDGTTITANLTGLTPEVTYYARVKADCGGGDQSYWIQTEFIPTDVIPLVAVNGTYSNGYVPLYCQYANYGIKSQFIIPRTRLFETVDGEIKALTFYCQPATASNFGDASFKVYLAEVDFTTFNTSEYYNWTDMNKVYEGHLYCDGNQMTITFDTPYYYNGGNLMIGFIECEPYQSMTSYYWYAEYLNNVYVSVYSYGAYVYPDRYLPNTTVHYVSRGITDTPRPKYLTANCVLARTATMKWVAPAENVTGYQYQYKADGAEEWTVGSTTDTVVNLTDLTVVTPYTFQVKALYPNEGESAYANVSFTTHNICDYPSDITATLIPYNGSTATISWTENGEATSWVLQYNTDNVFDTESTVEITEGFEVVDGNHVSCVLTGLTEAYYYVRVRPACGEEELWTTMNDYFQPTYASFSFNENNTYRYYNNYVPVYGNYTNYGTASQFIIPAEMLSDLAGGTLQRMRFRSHNSYSVSSTTFGDAEFEVYMKEVDNTSFASSSLSDWEDWEDMDEVYHGVLTFSSKQMWIDFDTAFVYGGDNLLIGFKQITPGSNGTVPYWVGKGNGPTHSAVYAYKSYSTATTFNNTGYATNYYDSKPFLPEIIFRYIPTEYPRMDTVVTVDVASNLAQFSWEAPNENVTGYAYQVKLRNEEWPEEWIALNDTEVTIEGLRQAKHYRFRVKALYGENESVPYTVDFLTECGVYADIPFFEDFEGFGSGMMPYCWNRIGNSNTPWVQLSTGEFDLGKYYLSFQYGSSSNYPDQYAILPQMQDINDLRVKFYGRVENTERPVDIYVGVMTDPTDANTFTQLGMVTAQTYTYKKFKVSLDGYTGSGYIALKVAPTENGLYSNLYVDNVTVEPIPSCEEPEFEEILNVTGHTATLRWTDDGASAWQVYASTENVMPADTEAGQEVTTNPGTITGLEAETDYYAWVRSLCGDGTYSHWSDAIAFTTDVACPIPVNLEVTNVTGHTATLAWTDLYGDPTEWEIEYYYDGEPTIVTADSVPFTLSGLDAESGYYDVKVRAWCGETDRWSDWSSTTSFYTPVSCFPVTDLEVTFLGTSTATLAWDTDPQQEAGNAPSVWIVDYLTEPAVTYDFETESGIPEYSVDNSDYWTIVNTDTIATLTAHSGTQCLVSSNDGDTYIYIPAYGGAVASFWAKSYNENDTVAVTVYYSGNSSSGGESGGGYKGRGHDKGRVNRDEYMGWYLVTSDSYKKITVDLADYQGSGSLNIRVSGQVALDDVTVNMPVTTVTQQTLDFNQGSIGDYAQYWGGWSLVIDGDDGYILSEENHDEAYVDFPVQLGNQISFRAKALVDENDTIKYYLYVWKEGVGLIAQDSIMVTDTFEDYTWDLSQYSGTAYLEFYAEYQPSLVIDDLTIPMVSTYTDLIVEGEPTLQMTDLQQLAVYTVGVQAHCGEGDESTWETLSFVPALCESEDQCQISYEWNTVDDAWNDAYLKVIHHESGLRVAQCQMEVGTSGMGYFSLCDGEVYDLYYDAGGKGYVDFTVYDPAGEVIASYAMFQSLTEDDDPYITFTMDCSVCQWPQNLMASNLTTQSATLTWEQGGDVTSWLVSYKDLNAMGDVILNQSDWTAVPQGWLPLTFDEDDDLVETEDWTPGNGALVSDTMSFLFIPVSLGGQAVVTARGSENEALLVGVYQGGSPVGMNMDNLPEESVEQHYLSEDPQQYVVDLSGYQGEGYLFLYHGCGNEPANLYLDQLVVYGPAAWSEGVVVNTTPTYTIEGLTPGTAYQAMVQAACGVGEYGNPRMVSFATPFCNPENQCEISYVLSDSYGDSWENAYVSVVHHDSDTEVARLTMKSNDGHELVGTLALCDGETYDFMYVNDGCCVDEHRFAIYDPSGEVVMDYLNETPNQTDVVSYTMDCSGMPTTVQLSEGWNWWAPTMEISATYVGDAIGENIQGFMTEDGEFDGVFVPGKMYRIKVSEACEFTLNGTPAASAQVSLAPGAHWFGFIGTETSVTVAFADFGPVDGDKVISQDGGFAIYTASDGWVGTLTNLVPGKGYVYVSNATETKTLYLGQQQQPVPYDD